MVEHIASELHLIIVALHRILGEECLCIDASNLLFPKLFYLKHIKSFFATAFSERTFGSFRCKDLVSVSKPTPQQLSIRTTHGRGGQPSIVCFGVLHRCVEPVQKLVSQQIIVSKIELTSGVVEAGVVPGSGEVQPFRVSEFIAW